MTQYLTLDSARAAVKFEKSASDKGERLLRMVQGAAMIALAFHKTEVSLFGRTVNLTQLQATVGKLRFAYYAHLAVHDALEISDPKNKEPGVPYLQMLDAFVAALFLDDLGLINLGKNVDLAVTGFQLCWIFHTVDELGEKASTYKEAKGGQVGQARWDLLFAAVETAWLVVDLRDMHDLAHGMGAVTAGAMGLLMAWPAGEKEKTN